MNATIRFLLLLPLFLLAGCSPQEQGVWQGYLEGEYVYVTAPLGGALQELAVSRGDAVQAGERLFTLDPEPERAGVQEAQQRVAQAEARLANLTKGLRASEIAALEARLTSARAEAEWAESEVQRFEKLRQDGVIAAEEMDRARTRRDAARASVASLVADMETAQLGGRPDEIEAGAGEVGAAQAALSRAQWALEQKQQSSPAQGIVDDTFFRPGEWVPPGRPVVSLLPPENLKVRFFVPQAQLSSFQPGMSVGVSFDGGGKPVPAVVNFISTQAEFTPPVIYSRENRAKLVFMIEARFSPGDAAQLRPGQPVDVRVGP